LRLLDREQLPGRGLCETPLGNQPLELQVLFGIGQAEIGKHIAGPDLMGWQFFPGAHHRTPFVEEMK